MEKILKVNKLCGGNYQQWQIGECIHIPTSNVLYYESLYLISHFTADHISKIQDTAIRKMVESTTDSKFWGSRIILKETYSNGEFVEFNVVQSPNEISEQFEA